MQYLPLLVDELANSSRILLTAVGNLTSGSEFLLNFHTPPNSLAHSTKKCWNNYYCIRYKKTGIQKRNQKTFLCNWWSRDEEKHLHVERQTDRNIFATYCAPETEWLRRKFETKTSAQTGHGDVKGLSQPTGRRHDEIMREVHLILASAFRSHH